MLFLLSSSSSSLLSLSSSFYYYYYYYYYHYYSYYHYYYYNYYYHYYYYYHHYYYYYHYYYYNYYYYYYYYCHYSVNNIPYQCDITCAGHFTLDALASRTVACILLGVTYANMLVAAQWPLKCSPHFPGSVWYGESGSSLKLFALC